jgi:hypothetical protein
MLKDKAQAVPVGVEGQLDDIPKGAVPGDGCAWLVCFFCGNGISPFPPLKGAGAWFCFSPREKFAKYFCSAILRPWN